MVRTVLIVLGLVATFQLSAVTNQVLIKNLSSRLKDLPNGKGSLIKSFANHSQSYIYDQALAVIAYTREDDQKSAQRLLSGLKSLQLRDGSLYFSYYLDGTSPYPDEGDKRISGAMAWVALAATHYQHRFRSKEFLEFNHKILSYLETQIIPIEVTGKKLQALVFAPNDVESTAFNETDVAALEHNLDAYVAFTHFTRINRNREWKHHISELRKFILAMWDPVQLHFWSGASFKERRINKTEFYLDNQSWSLLALDNSSLNEISPRAALQKNCEYLFVKQEGLAGFMDSKATRRPASHEFIWSEGTLGQVLAMMKIHKLQEAPITCNGQSSFDFISSIKKMRKEDGGIGYATITEKKDFTSSSSVAGTAWMYFAANEFNPFELDYSD